LTKVIALELGNI